MCDKTEDRVEGGCCLFIVLFFIGYFIVWFCTRTDNTRAISILENQGYSQVTAHGYSWFSCAASDWSATKFTAYLNGRQITGAVCCGFIFKNCTVRYN